MDGRILGSYFAFLLGFFRGTLIAEIGLFVVGAYYVLVWRSLRKSSETRATPDAPFPPLRTRWSELRYLQWGMLSSVLFFMFAGAADSQWDWLIILANCLMGFCAAVFFAMFGVGFVSLFHLWNELVPQLKKARMRSLLLSFPLAIFWLVLGLAVVLFLGMIVDKIPVLLEQLVRYALWGLIAIVFLGLWMGRSHAALMLRSILMVLFSAIMIVAVAFGYWWIIGQTTLLLVLFLSVIGALNVAFYSRWVPLTALNDNLMEPPDLV